MKKWISILLCISITAGILTGCGGTSTESGSGASKEAGSSTASEGKTAETKVGIIYIGDENDGYTASHMSGIASMKKTLGLTDDQVIEKTNIPESEACYDAAVDLAEQGCTIIFSTSFGHEDFLKQAASEYPAVEFCAISGYQAASSGPDNMHNFYTKISEARYVSGVVAGLKLQEMIDSGKITADKAKLGYVGAYPYAEVISGFTAFYLGAKSVVDSATMKVIYTNSWGDASLESETANSLIADGCVIISQQANTTGAPSACEASGVPVVGYNIDMRSVAPKCALTSPTDYWGVGYSDFVETVMNGEKPAADKSYGIAEAAVGITELGTSCAEGTQEKADTVIAGIKDGSLHIFDESRITVGGKSMKELNYKIGDKDYSKYFTNGYFHEGELASTPAFDIVIDGIETAD